jgi:hypothetical protein
MDYSFAWHCLACWCQQALAMPNSEEDSGTPQHVCVIVARVWEMAQYDSVCYESENVWFLVDTQKTMLDKCIAIKEWLAICVCKITGT